MEQALFVTKTENFKYWDDSFSRLYYGTEFCERLLPADSELKEAIRFATKKQAGFTLVTPYVTSKGLDRVGKILGLVAEEGVQCETVFNDWGVFHLLGEEHPGIVPVMGRLLTKMKRGPRLMAVIDRIPKTAAEYFRTPNLNSPHVSKFLLAKGIGRVELDNLLQGLNLDGIDPELRHSLYLPFAYVTTTRFCLMASGRGKEREFEIGVTACRRECQESFFQLNHPIMAVPLYRRGNTIFLMNENLPDVISKGAVDRVVLQPEIPI